MRDLLKRDYVKESGGWGAEERKRNGKHMACKEKGTANDSPDSNKNSFHLMIYEAIHVYKA